MLQHARLMPGEIVRDDPAKHHDANAHKAQPDSRAARVIGAEHDVVHVAREPGHDHQGDVHDQKREKAEHGEEVNGARRLPSAE